MATQWLSISTDLTDVTLVSDDTYWWLGWCYSSNWEYWWRWRKDVNNDDDDDVVAGTKAFWESAQRSCSLSITFTSLLKVDHRHHHCNVHLIFLLQERVQRRSSQWSGHQVGFNYHLEACISICSKVARIQYSLITWPPLPPPTWYQCPRRQQNPLSHAWWWSPGWSCSPSWSTQVAPTAGRRPGRPPSSTKSTSPACSSLSSRWWKCNTGRREATLRLMCRVLSLARR